MKVVGEEHGIGLTGLLGGLVSSTAVTLGFSQRSREHPTQSTALALGILVAWTVMFVRVVVLVAAVDRCARAARRASRWRPSSCPASRSASCCGAASAPPTPPPPRAGENPFELGAAIRFGLLFGFITFVAKAAQVYLGDAGLYLAAALAGLTDVDAISLSMAQLSLSDPGMANPAARAILIAVVANTVFKAGMVATTGAPAMRRLVVAATVVTLVVAGAAMFLV